MKHLTEHILWLWFHLSPTIYVVTLIPLRWRGIYDLNPLTTLYDGFREAVIYNHLPSTSLLHFVILSAAALAVLGAGFMYFVSASRSFAKVS